MNIIRKIRNKILGNYKLALKNGLVVGKGVSIMGGVNFGSEPYLITLGDFVRLSFDVVLITHDGGTWAFRDNSDFSKVIKYGRINIGSYTFIGARSIIMPGVTIGERCVIGAGSIVTKDIPDGSVACGSPAKVITTTDDYAKKCKECMRPYNEKEYLENKKDYLQRWLVKNYKH